MYMLCYGTGVVNPAGMINVPTGNEVAHALETLVGTGVRVALRLRPNPNVPVDAPRRRGRPKKYGRITKVAALLKNTDRLQEATLLLDLSALASRYSQGISSPNVSVYGNPRRTEWAILSND